MYLVKVLKRFQRKPSNTANILVYHIKFRSHWVTHLSHSLCLYTPLVCQDRLRRMSSYNMMLDALITDINHRKYKEAGSFHFEI